jgi:hypothetical protein
MGLIRLGRVIKSYIAKVPGSGLLAQWLAVEEFAGDERKAQVFGACNEDFAPPNNCKTIDVALGVDRGFLAAVAYRNELITPIAEPGERRLFSTNAAGDTVMTEVYLQDDGTVEIKNDNGSIKLAVGGRVLVENANGSIDLKATGAIELTSAVSIALDAPVIESNGDSDNLITWADLNTAIQSFMVALNAHGHTGAGGIDTGTLILDIDAAKADTLKTDG